jgi:hypothetical protein
MATNSDSSGAVGVLGVLIGAIIVILIGGLLLLNSGMLGNQPSSIKIELPKVSGGK